MTRSIFDPTGGETEHSGSRNLGPDASEISQMRPDLVDGVVDCEEEKETVDMRPFVDPPEDHLDAAAVDAPQEADVLDDPGALIEGQPTDESDAPQDAQQ
jgi:hypothetical protein